MNRSKTFDMVVPVYNSMHHVRTCLRSLQMYSTPPFHVYVVDDGSNVYTKCQLNELIAQFPTGTTTLITQPQNSGYLAAVNQGISTGSGEIVIIVNSDTAVMSGFLERLESVLDKDPSIGIINPVSTWANWTRIPFPDGSNVHTVNEVVTSQSDPVRDIYNASGFFFVVRRSLYESLGLFDEAYAPGYWEEADFCMRALSVGYRIVVDPSLYIYHYGWGTFEQIGRDTNMSRNKTIFMKRWQSDYEKYEVRWKKENALGKVNARIEKANFTNPPRNRGGKRLRVTYILPGLALFGGVISVVQLVNELVWRGIDAMIASVNLGKIPIDRYLPLSYRPLIYCDYDALVRDLPESDIIVATHWSTVAQALRIKWRYPNTQLVYFVQDFEPDFYPQKHDLRTTAERTYCLIKNRIAKTPWLVNRLSSYGGHTELIPLGLNLDVYNDHGGPRAPRLVTMARPSSGYRNWPMIVRVYRALSSRRPDIERAVYGFGYDISELGGDVIDYGSISQMSDVARMLNECRVVLDCSTFQGFGRPGVEAMATGTATVLTCRGGITSYAKHNVNTLLIDPENEDAIVGSIERLFDDVALRERLVDAGRRTARALDLALEAERTIAYFEKIYSSAF